MDPIFLYPVAAAQMVMEKRMEAITNNIANVDTTGFRRDIPIFAAKIATLAKAHALGGASDMTGENSVFSVRWLGRAADPSGGHSIVPVPSWPVLDEVVTDFSQGAIHHTENPLDVAINGKGFFQIQTPNGVRYTRNGSFRLSAEGQIVTQAGQTLLGEGGPITLPPGHITIDEEGKISVKGLGGGSPEQVGLISLITVDDLSKMKKIGDNLFELVGASPVPVEEEAISVHQGSLERSNVDPIIEMVAMISAMRSYESAQKAIQGADDIALKNVNQVGQLKA